MKTLIIALILISSFPAYALMIFHIKGNVAVDGMPATKGQELKIGQTVTTGPGGLAVLKQKSQSVIRVEENSLLEIDKIDEGGKLQTSFLHKSGSVMIDVIKKLGNDESFEVKFKTNASIDIKGTKLFTHIDETNENIWVVVKEGVVNARGQNPAQHIDVKAGEEVVYLSG